MFKNMSIAPEITNKILKIFVKYKNIINKLRRRILKIGVLVYINLIVFIIKLFIILFYRYNESKK